MKLNEIEYDLTMVGQWLGKKFNKKGTYIDYGLVPSNTTYYWINEHTYYFIIEKQ